MTFSDKFKVIIPPQDIACEPGLQQKLANGDRDAFSWVYRNYCQQLYDYALLMTRCVTTSEDIVQDVFIRLWTNRQKLHAVKDFNAYLYAMNRHYILNLLGRQKMEMKVRNLYCEDKPKKGITPEEAMATKELQQTVLQAIKKLPHQQQLVFRLRDQGCSRNNIAQELGLSPFTVKNHVRQALKSLKRKVH